MADSITLSGTVATVPNHRRITDDLDVVSFRLASTQWRFDPATKEFTEGLTSWYTVSCFRRLAAAAQHTVHKGQRVVVGGKLRVRDWENGERRGTSVEIDADVVGVDIGWLSRHQPGERGAEAGVSEAGPDDGSPRTAVDAAGWALGPGSVDGDDAPVVLSDDRGAHESVGGGREAAGAVGFDESLEPTPF